jgi:DNA-binding NarL/FixJ family response regulator
VLPVGWLDTKKKEIGVKKLSPNGEVKKARVFIVDDHPIVRRGLQFMLNSEANMMVCGEAESGPEALSKIEAAQPDVAIVDLRLKSGSGLDLIRNLRIQFPKLKLLVFSMHDEMFYAQRVLRLGAHGYVTKEDGAEKAMDALRLILNGKRYVSPAIADRIFNRLSGPDDEGKTATVEQLSDRELEVLQLIGEGLGTRTISERLGLSIKTIESYRENIKAKLGLASAAELTNYSYNWANRNRAA